MSNKEPAGAEVLRGTLDLMVLQTLAALGQHGYAIGAAGRGRLAADKKAWDQMVSVMHTLFEDPA